MTLSPPAEPRRDGHDGVPSAAPTAGLTTRLHALLDLRGRPLVVHAGLGHVHDSPKLPVLLADLAVLRVGLGRPRRLIQVGFMRRYDPAYLQVKSAMTDGTIGEPLLAHSVHRNPSVPDWFQSAMSLYDSVVHEFDMFRWLFDQEIIATTAIPVRRSPLAATHLSDPQFVLLELENGCLVDVESFVNCQYGYDVRTEVVGSTGAITVQNPAITAVSRDGLRREPVPPDWRVRFGTAYLAELQSWVAHLESGDVVGPSAWDGYAAIAVAESAVTSSTSGSRTAVELIEKPALYV